MIIHKKNKKENTYVLNSLGAGRGGAEGGPGHGPLRRSLLPYNNDNNHNNDNNNYNNNNNDNYDKILK